MAGRLVKFRDVRLESKGQRRDQANDAFGHALGRFGKTVMTFGGGSGELIEPASKPDDHAVAFQAGEGRGRDTRAADFSQAGNALPARKAAQPVALPGSGL
jgi:hypothetical protein